MYDLVIIGGGPGGVAAGIYAARKKIKSLIVTDSFGGQSIVSADIQNWIGIPSISGFDLAQQLEKHLRMQEGIEIWEGEWVSSITDAGDHFTIATQSGKSVDAKYLLLATGSHRRRLGIPGEKEFEGKGVVYCSICDAPLFKDKTVVVVGGGNAGLEAVVDLLPYAKKIYLMDRNPAPKGDAVTLEKIKAHPNVEFVLEVQPQKILGEAFVTGVEHKHVTTGDVQTLPVEGVFVEIGLVPNSDLVKDIMQVNPMGEVVIDHATCQTSHPRAWAVGDVSDARYKQNNISVGDAVKATLEIYDLVSKRK